MVNEILRVHPGVVNRLGRVAPDREIVYQHPETGKKMVIPRGTSVNMNPAILHMNESVFPDPYAFRPERWVENPRLDRYLLAFAKGTRNCLG